MYPGPLTPSTAPFQCGGRGSTLSPSQQDKLLTVILMLSPEAHICDLFWSKTHSSWSQVTRGHRQRHWSWAHRTLHQEIHPEIKSVQPWRGSKPPITSLPCEPKPAVVDRLDSVHQGTPDLFTTFQPANPTLSFCHPGSSWTNSEF